MTILTVTGNLILISYIKTKCYLWLDVSLPNLIYKSSASITNCRNIESLNLADCNHLNMDSNLLRHSNFIGIWEERC